MSNAGNAELRIKGGKTIQTHFNPATLQLALSTKLAEGKGQKRGGRQVVNEGSAKLSADLLFDTTDTLENVCDKTVEVARLLGEKNQPPPQVTLAWGAFQFSGIVDSYKEVIDFFSPDGVPLRSTVSISMTQDEDIYARGTAGQRAAGWSGSPGSGDAAQVSAPPPGGSTTTTATQGGDPRAGRSIAAQNGEENMRFPKAPTLTVDASITLAPPVAFSAGADFGVSASAGFGVSTSASLSFGGSTSAGIPATEGAFAGLRTPSATSPVRLDTTLLMNRVETNTYATDSGSVFELGGRIKTRGSSLGGGTKSRLRFEEE